MVGEPIPWRKMGYQTLEEFLDQSPDLCRVSYTNEGVVVRGIATEASAHVAKLVSQQNTKKRSKPVKPPSRRPFTRQWQPPQSSQPFRGNPYNRNHQGGGGGGNRPSRPGGSGRFPTLQNRSPQALAQYQQQQQQRLRTPNYPAVNGMSRGGAGRTQAKPQAQNQVCPHILQRVVFLPVFPSFACSHVSNFSPICLHFCIYLFTSFLLHYRDLHTSKPMRSLSPNNNSNHHHSSLR